MGAGPGETMMAILRYLGEAAVMTGQPGVEDTLHGVAVFGVVTDYIKTGRRGAGDGYWRDPTTSEWVSIRRAVRSLLRLGYIEQWTEPETIIGYRDPSGAPIVASERWLRITPAGSAYLESTYDDD